MIKTTTSKVRLLAAIASLALLGAVTSTLHAEDAPAAPAAAAAATPAPTPIAFTNAPVAAQTAYLQAALTNGDPTATNIAPTAIAGHNAWMMVSSAFVLMMTLPGLALFYGGLVRSKNILSIIAMCFGITAMVSVIWWAVGYSLVFGSNFASPFLGGTENFFFKGITSDPNQFLCVQPVPEQPHVREFFQPLHDPNRDIRAEPVRVRLDVQHRILWEYFVDLENQLILVRKRAERIRRVIREMQGE